MAKKQEEPVLFCQVAVNCAGIKRPQFSGQKVKYKNYRAGESIKGILINDSDVPTNYIPAIRTKDGFIINQSNVMVLGEEQDVEIVNDKDVPVSERLKKRFSPYLNAESTGGAKGIVSDQMKKSKYLLNGAVVGGVILTIYAVAKGKNKTGYFIFGALVGGFIGKAYAGMKQDKDDNEY